MRRQKGVFASVRDPCHVSRLRVVFADTYKSLCSKGQFLSVRYFSIPTGKRNEIWLAQERAALAVIERMQIASVLHYSYRSTELPLGENTDISVAGFAAAWKNLQETFNQELKWRYAAYQKEQELELKRRGIYQRR